MRHRQDKKDWKRIKADIAKNGPSEVYTRYWDRTHSEFQRMYDETLEALRHDYYTWIEKMILLHLSLTGGRAPLMIPGWPYDTQYLFDECFANWETWLKGLIWI